MITGRDPDVVVIGGGVMGLFTAFFLADQGVSRIVVLEKRFLGAGSTGKSGAILRQHYSHETTVRMARESLAFYRDFENRYGRDLGFRQTGMLFTCRVADRAALEANVTLQRSIGVDVELLETDALRTLEPRARYDEDVVAALEREAGYVDPGLTLAALSSLLRERGVEIIEHAEVTEIERDDTGGVIGVCAGDRRFTADVVINAGGPWAGRLCAEAGVDLPLKAIRPEQAFFVPPAVRGRERLIQCDLLTGLYWKPETAGWTRVGRMAYDGDAEVDPDDYDEGVSDAFINACRRSMADRLPDYADAVSWGGCAALYTVTPDAHALVGPVPGIPGFCVASGFSGHGFKLGPSVGRGLAAMITGADAGSFDASFFAVDRFERGETVGTSYKYGILG